MNSPPSSSTISSLYHDILLSHILTRLDAPSLASFSSSSSLLHSLSSYPPLWQNICTSTWPSINHSLISSLISSFPSGYCSFFSDAYPLIHHHRHSSLHDLPFPQTTELISAVDIYYQNSPIFSKVVQTDTATGWFNCSPFRLDLLGPKEFVPTCIQQASEEDLRIHQLEQNVTLSWILIDPKHKRAVNLSSQKAVAVQRHWLTGEVQVKFAVVMAGEGGKKESEKEYVKCEVVVTCGGRGGEEVDVRDVSMTMEDMEGKGLNGGESLVIIREAMEKGERRKLKGEKEGKERYKEFLERRRERKEKLQRREKYLDWVCIGIATGVNCLVAFWSYMIFG